MKGIDLIKYFRFIYSKEFKDLKEIILAGENNDSITNLSRECDKVFIERLRDNPNWLSIKAWETHFEWKDLLNDYPEISGNILDFGCGSGHSDILLARAGRTIYGIDLSPIGIEIADYYKKKEDLEVQKRLNFEFRDITSENTLGKLFDSAWSSHVFEHIENPGPILIGLKNYLKKGAPLLISVPFKNSYNDPGHVNHFYSQQELKDWLSPYIKVDRVDLSEKNQVLRALCINE